MTQVLLLCALVVILCIASGKISSRLGIPSLLLFIGLGMVFGSDGLLKIPFDNYAFAEQICSVALIFIMFYGGFGTNWKKAKPVAKKAAWLSTLGVVLTALLTGLFCYFILRFPPLESLLVGSVLSSTDAASVFAVLRSKKLNLRHGTASLLEVESGSNDPASYMLTMSALTLMSGAKAGKLAYMFFSQIVYGILIGVIIALAARFVLKKFDFTKSGGLDSVFVFAIAIFAYALPATIGGNGYLSVYLAGIILGNSEIKNKISLVHFFDGITDLAQIAIFFLLGLLATPSRMPSILLPAIGIVLFLTFVARPLAVFTILGPARCTMQQQLLVSWAGLRGAASIVFAIMATVSDVYTKYDLFHIVFCVALFSVAFQGTLLPKVAQWLHMVSNDEDVLKTFTDYQDETEMQLIKVFVPEGHPYVGKMLNEIKMAIGALVVMIKRGSEYLIPHGDTVIQQGDMLVLGGEEYREEDQVKLRELKIGADHSWAGREIKELSLPSKTLIIMLKKGDGSMLVPNGETRIEADDVVVLSS